MFIFQSFQKNLQKREKKLKKIHVGFEKSINLFEIKKVLFT